MNQSAEDPLGRTRQASQDTEPVVSITSLTGPEERTLAPETFDIIPLSFLGIIHKALLICKLHFWRLVVVAGVPWMITALTAVYLIAFWRSLMPISDNLGAGGLILLLPISIWSIVLVFVFAQTVLLHAVSKAYIGRKIGIGQALLFGLVKMKTVAPTSFVFVFFVFLIGCGLGWILLILGSLLSDFLKNTLLGPVKRELCIAFSVGLLGFVFVRVMLFDKVAAIENLDSLKALSRSWELLSGKAADTTWPRRYDLRMFFLIALWLLMSIVAFMLVGKLMHGFVAWMSPLPDNYANSWMSILTAVSGLIAGLFGSVATTVFYYDIRFRKDRLDPATILAPADTSLERNEGDNESLPDFQAVAGLPNGPPENHNASRKKAARRLRITLGLLGASVIGSSLSKTLFSFMSILGWGMILFVVPYLIMQMCLGSIISKAARAGVIALTMVLTLVLQTFVLFLVLPYIPAEMHMIRVKSDFAPLIQYIDKQIQTKGRAPEDIEQGLNEVVRSFRSYSSHMYAYSPYLRYNCADKTYLFQMPFVDLQFRKLYARYSSTNGWRWYMDEVSPWNFKSPANQSYSYDQSAGKWKRDK